MEINNLSIDFRHYDNHHLISAVITIGCAMHVHPVHDMFAYIFAIFHISQYGYNSHS